MGNSGELVGTPELDKRSLLQRNYHIKLPDYDEYIVLAHPKNVGDEIKTGDVIVRILCIRKKTDGDKVTIEKVELDCCFASKWDKEAVIDEYCIEEGQKLSARAHLALKYSVGENFQNLVHSHVLSSTKTANDLHAHPHIPENKLNNAISAYAKSVDKGRVLFLYDDTLFGSAKDGYIITDSAFYYKSSNKEFSFRYNDVVSCEIVNCELPTEEKPNPEKALRINLTEDRYIVVKADATGLKLSAFVNFIELVLILKNIGETKAVDGYVILEDMPNPVKLCYANLLIWLTYIGDGTIDEREISELQVLMTQLKFDADLRHEIRSTIYNPALLKPHELLKEMLRTTPSGSEFALKISLLKDAVRIHRAASETSAIGAEAVQKMADLLELDDGKLVFLDQVCEEDEKILSGEISDSQLTANLKGTAARASAVGVPIAAVYLSGSVTGLSAAGITSGLASLGLGGVLGLSSMVTGIGVVILLGVTAYQGVKWLSGESERNKAGRRELMLQEVMRVHQKAISNLAEDIAFFGQKMVALTEEVEKNKATIVTMSREMTMFANALKQLRQREAGYEQSLHDEIQARAA